MGVWDMKGRYSKKKSVVLAPTNPPRKRAPRLPAARQWDPLTKQWWRDVWSSPMAREYLQSDIHGLIRLAVLVDMFWFDPSPKLASEIRLQQQAYGLSPIDRRRLQWTVEQAESARDKRERQRAKNAVVISDDPREFLK
jgi:hypothetical protein